MTSPLCERRHLCPVVSGPTSLAAPRTEGVMPDTMHPVQQRVKRHRTMQDTGLNKNPEDSVMILLRMLHTHDFNMRLNNWIVWRNSRDIIQEQIQTNARKIQSPKPAEEVVRGSFGRTESVRKQSAPSLQTANQLQMSICEYIKSESKHAIPTWSPWSGIEVLGEERGAEQAAICRRH